MNISVSAKSPAPKMEAALGNSSVAQTSTAVNPATGVDATAARGFLASARRARATATQTTSARVT